MRFEVVLKFLRVTSFCWRGYNYASYPFLQRWSKSVHDGFVKVVHCFEVASASV